MSECCDDKPEILLYSCSGAANVAEVADLAVRELQAEGCASMFCLAAVGAGIEDMVKIARDADQNVVIDGCPMDCAKQIFDRAGIKNYVQIRVTDLGIAKSKGVRATDAEVQQVAEKVRVTIDSQ